MPGEGASNGHLVDPAFRRKRARGGVSPARPLGTRSERVDRRSAHARFRQQLRSRRRRGSVATAGRPLRQRGHRRRRVSRGQSKRGCDRLDQLVRRESRATSPSITSLRGGPSPRSRRGSGHAAGTPARGLGLGRGREPERSCTTALAGFRTAATVACARSGVPPDAGSVSARSRCH